MSQLSDKKQALLDLLLQDKGLEKHDADRIPSRADRGDSDLSFAQQRLWFIDQLEPGLAAYHIGGAARLEGALDVSALEKSFSEIMRRHEVLRSGIVNDNGRPKQRVLPAQPFVLPRLDLQQVALECRFEEARRLAKLETREPFDLASGPLFRAKLLRLDRRDHVLVLTMHHIASDGWSIGVLIEELSTFYDDYASGRLPSLPDPPLQYADYAAWQRQVLEEKASSPQLAYWRKQLEGMTPLDLPTDKRRPAELTLRGARSEMQLPGELASALKELSMAHGATLFMTLLAAFDTLLYRYTGQSDIAIGTAIAGRNRVELEKLIGFFVNTLVLRSEMSGDPTFLELLSRVQQVVTDAFSHQELPFDMLVDELQPERTLSHVPLVPVLFAFQNMPRSVLHLSNLKWQPLEFERDVSRFDLCLFMSETPEGLIASMEYSTDLFAVETIKRLLNHFRILLEAIVDGPRRRISTLNLMSDEERSQLSVERTDVHRSYPRDKCVHELFEKQAQLRPDAKALVFGDDALTYGELNSRANRMAHFLRTQGVGPEVMVGVCMDRRLDLIVCMLGVLKAGGAYVPLDPDYPTERLAAMLKDTRVSVMLTETCLESSIPEQFASAESNDVDDRAPLIFCVDRDWSIIAQHGDENPQSGATAENLAYVMYTSGSAGVPKGVQIPHRGIVRLLFGIDYVHLGPEETFLQLASVSFDASTFEIWAPLLHGGKLVLFPDRVPDLNDLDDALQRYEITTLWLTASLYNLVVDQYPRALSGVRQLLIGGEALSVSHVRRGLESLPDTRIINGYGPTESTTFACCHRIPKDLDDESKSIPIGRPIANTQVYVLDKHMNIVPVGIPGELYIGGDGLARGYLNDPDLTARKFVTHPIASEYGGRLYKTGDRVRRLSTGLIEFLGRQDNQIKIRGFRIELGEIEALLMTHPTVREVTVYCREDTPGTKRLCAYIVTKTGTSISVRELTEFLRNRLPDYAVPTAMIQMAEFPLTANGKVDRNRLPAPESGLDEIYAEPRSPHECLLARIWSDVLGVDVVGVHDNFFDLGGDSILSIQIVARAKEVGLKLRPKDVFRHQTIERLANVAEAVTKGEPVSPGKSIAELEQAALDNLHAAHPNIEDVYSLSPMQAGMLFHHLVAPERGLYHEQCICRLEGALDVSAFRHAWEYVIGRQPVLRTAIVWEGLDDPVQIVEREVALPWIEHDWRSRTQSECDECLDRLVSDDRHQGFDLTQAPAMRLYIAKIANDIHDFVWSFHHILLDGWSVSRVLHEVMQVYQSRLGKIELQLPSCRPYRDYIAWLEGRDTNSVREFWTEYLAGFDSPTGFGVGRAGGESSVFSEAFVEIAGPQAELFRAWARRQKLTLNTLFQGAWALLLSRYTGNENVVFGATVAGRPPELDGVETMLGLFINTLPVRVSANGGAMLTDWLRRLQDHQVEQREFEHTPLSDIQRWSDIEQGRPLFESLLVFENYPVERVVDGNSVGFRTTRKRFVERTNYPLSLVVSPGQTLGIRVIYDAERFEDSEIARLLGHFRVLLERMCEPERRLRDLDLLTKPERQELLVDWRRTSRAYPRDATVPALFEAQVARSADETALVDGDHRMTYGELNARANQLAHYLRRGGVGPDVLVGVFMHRGVDMVVALLAILKAGGAYVPLDTEYPAQRLAAMLADAGCEILLTENDLLDRLPDYDGRIIGVDDERKTIADQSLTNPPHETSAKSLAYVIYTSGSTGEPKGVCVPHRAIVRLVVNTDYVSLKSTDCIAQASNASFDAATFEIWGALLNGARLTVMSKEVLFSPPTFADVLRKEGVTVMFLTTALFNQYAREVPDAFASLRYLLFGGEAVDPQWVRRVLADGAPQHLLHVYGPTENTTFSTWFEVTDVAEGATTIPIGQPIANSHALVLDHHGNPVPVGVQGELYLGGDGLASGYLNDDQMSADRFVIDRFSDDADARLYMTGDMVRQLEGGNIEFIGRRDHQVKMRGFRIELGEIETALGRHPSVSDVVVLCRQDVPGVKRLCAYVVPMGGVVVSGADLGEFLRDCLPDYMIPSAYVELSSLPLNANGKVDRGALPAPEGSSEAVFVGPRNEREKILADIWSEVLHADRVGVFDNFFELGGDSILSIQIASRARRAGFTVTPRQVFEHQHVADLAARCEGCGSIDAEQGPVTGEVPLTPVQRWYLDSDPVEPDFFNQSMLLEAQSELDSEWLSEAFRLLIAHHDALRLRLAKTDFGWRQKIVPIGDTALLEHVDLSGSALDEQRNAIESKANELQAGLNLQDGPVIRAVRFELGGTGNDRLLIVIHHMAVDGVSWRILIEDLQHVYQQLVADGQAQLPAKTSSFPKWSHCLIEYAKSDGVHAEIEHWLAQTATASLPIDDARVGSAHTLESADSVSAVLTVEETKSLLHDVPRAYNTRINDVLLTAVAHAFRAWTGSSSLLVDLEGHGREPLFDGVDLSRTIGWFTSIYPVRLEVNGGGPGEDLKCIKEQLRLAPNNGVGFGILRYLADEDTRQKLLQCSDPQVGFNYLGQFDQLLSAKSLFRMASESSGRTQSPKARRRHLIDIAGYVIDGQLRMNWAFGKQLVERRVVAMLADEFLAALRRLIEHCAKPKTRGFTPSDFPLARLDQECIDNLSVAYPTLEDVYPLSPTQEGMLFHALMAPERGVYLNQANCVIKGRVNVDALRRAWDAVIARHPILRTAFAWGGLDAPMQIVLADAAMPWTERDWRTLAPGELEQRQREFLATDRERGFELNIAPALRVAIIRIAGEAYWYVFSFHHILLDGWSRPLLFKEVGAFYAAFDSGQEISLPRSRPYGDYIAWLKAQDLQSAEKYWQQHLAGFEAPTPLGIERSNHDGPRYGVEDALLGVELSKAIAEFARRHHLTPNTLVQGAWALLLSRYSDHDDVVFGATVSGRPPSLPDVESMMGLCINVLPRRIRIANESSVISWLRQMQVDHAEMRQFEYTPLVEIHGWCDLPAGTALFDTIVTFENQPGETMAVGTKQSQPVRTFQPTNYALSLAVVPGEPMSVRLTYDCRRFTGAAIQGIRAHFENLLQGLTEDPQQPLGEVSMLTAPERHWLLSEWNDTSPLGEPFQGLVAMFADHASSSPERPAVVDETTQITYGELRERTSRLAAHLQTLGAGRDRPVAVFLERSVDMIVALLAVLKSGSAYLPVDPTVPAARLAYMFEDCSVPIVVTQSSLMAGLPEIDGHVIEIDGVCVGWPRSADFVCPEIDADQLAYVIYTSGSSGRPKGVGVEHGQLDNYAKGVLAAIDAAPGAHFATVSTIAADLGNTAIFGALSSGGCVHVISDVCIADADLFANYVDSHAIDCLKIVPSHLEALLSGSRPERALPRQCLVLGGEACSWDLLDRVHALAPGCRVINHYGPTETTVGVLTYAFTEGRHRELAAPPIGRPMKNSTAYVLDSRGRPVPVGVAGELHIGGRNVTRGYLNQPELTREKFIPDVFRPDPGARLYKTGDRARFTSDGYLEFLGRVDDQIKVRGYRVEPGEIQALLSGHASVRDCVVVAREDTPSDRRLVAYYVAVDAVTAVDLMQFLKPSLPDYMIPGAWVAMSSLPLTANGKIDKRALPVPERPDDRGTVEPPRSPTERTLAELWREVLRVERVGLHDSFFNLGGHSLKITQLMSRIRRRFGVEVPLRRLFEEPTLEEQAASITQAMVDAEDRQELAEMIDQIKTLSDDELDNMVDESAERWET